MRLSNALVHLLCVSPTLITAVPFRYSGLLRPWRKLSGLVLQLTSDIPGPYAAGDARHQSKAQPDRISERLLARYGEDILLRFNISTADEAIALAQATNELLLDVWEFNSNWVDIRLAKHAVPWLLGLLPASLQDSHTPLMQGLDLAQAVFDSYPSSSPSAPSSLPGLKYNTLAPSLRASGTANTNIFFQDYQPLSVLTPWMRLMTSLYPTHVRMINIGTSYEGRDIPALRVGVHPKNNDKPSGPRKTIIVSGGSHAREWISTSTVTYLAYHLITGYGKTQSTTSLIEAFDWVFIPTLNPDGYVYTWSTDRLWRKNRQPTNLRFCTGLDLDRTYPFHWDGSTRGNPCSESYAGEAALESVESRRFAEWARNETAQNGVEFVGLLNLHSYSQQVLYPYSHSCAADPPGLESLQELALGLARAMRRTRDGHGHGHGYKVASACEGNVGLGGKGKGRTVLPRVEAGGGSALDWFYHEMKVKYAFQVKLRDTGNYGFLLPKENIVSTGEEALEAMLYFGRYLSGDVGLGLEEEEGGDSGNVHGREADVSQAQPQSEGEMLVYEDAAEGSAEQGEVRWEFKMRRRR